MVKFYTDLKKETNNKTAWACQKFVCNFLTFKYDDYSADCPEFWQFPFETIQSEIYLADRLDSERKLDP